MLDMLFIKSAYLTAKDTINETTTVIEETTTSPLSVISEQKEKVDSFFGNFDKYINGLIRFGISVLIALIIFFVGKIVIKTTLKILKNIFEKSKMEISVSKFLLSFIKVSMYVLLVSIICGQIGIQTTSIMAVVGTAGLTVGLALQGSLSNFAGGVLILILQPFKVGDYVIACGQEGTVNKIDIFYTTLITIDNKKTVIPNGTMANTTVTNVSAYDMRRVDIQFGISYSSDIEKAKEILLDIARKHEKTKKNLDILVYVVSLDESQVTLELRAWCETQDYWTTRFEIIEKAKIMLEENGIEIPFNQMVVHVENT